MKMTIITSADGEIIGMAPSHGRGASHEAQGKGPDGARGGVVAGPGQKAEEVDVPDELGEVEDGQALHARVKEHLKRGKA
jgi:hypothetical protein